MKAMRDKLIKHIEGNAQGEIQKIVGRVWGEIEESLRVDRKQRF